MDVDDYANAAVVSNNNVENDDDNQYALDEAVNDAEEEMEAEDKDDSRSTTANNDDAHDLDMQDTRLMVRQPKTGVMEELGYSEIGPMQSRTLHGAKSCRPNGTSLSCL